MHHEAARHSVGATRTREGFTLIEVLVVVAILALLIAILLPSLRDAREQAKITVCKANCKQIGHLVSLYRGDYQDYVPIMFNYYANGDPRHRPNPNGHNVPAKGCWLSVALHSYDRSTRNMRHVQSSTVPGRYFNPDENWGGAQGCKIRDEFENRMMPEFYACPFQRGRGNGEEIQYTDTRTNTQHVELRGRLDSYHTWLWSGLIIRNEIMQTVPGGSGLDGVVKYSALTWNKVNDDDTPLPSGYNRWDVNRADNPFFHRYHRRWNVGEVNKVRSASLAEVTVSWCAQGEHLALGNLRYNFGSHRTFQGGGCNAIFGDTHVEWVKGTRIGWR